MTCTKCDNTMSLCTCDDAEARIADLEKSPYLSMDWAGLRAARAANASKIARLKEDATKPFHPVAEFQRLTGFSLSPEAEAAARAHCDELVPDGSGGGDQRFFFPRVGSENIRLRSVVASQCVSTTGSFEAPESIGSVDINSGSCVPHGDLVLVKDSAKSPCL
jgi:hypothetical protein